jgi:hypothetical protein
VREAESAGRAETTAEKKTSEEEARGNCMTERG